MNLQLFFNLSAWAAAHAQDFQQLQTGFEQIDDLSAKIFADFPNAAAPAPASAGAIGGPLAADHPVLQQFLQQLLAAVGPALAQFILNLLQQKAA